MPGAPRRQIRPVPLRTTTTTTATPPPRLPNDASVKKAEVARMVSSSKDATRAESTTLRSKLDSLLRKMQSSAGETTVDFCDQLNRHLSRATEPADGILSMLQIPTYTISTSKLLLEHLRLLTDQFPTLLTRDRGDYPEATVRMFVDAVLLHASNRDNSGDTFTLITEKKIPHGRKKADYVIHGNDLLLVVEAKRSAANLRSHRMQLFRYLACFATDEETKSLGLLTNGREWEFHFFYFSDGLLHYSCETKDADGAKALLAIAELIAALLRGVDSVLDCL